MNFRDGFQNFLARLGLGANKLYSGASYAFDNFTRNITELEAAYRTNWLVGRIVDVVAEDMTREGIELGSGYTPEEKSRIMAELQTLRVFDSLRETIKLARLYGGSIAVMMVDGQDFSRPLDLSSIGPGAFRGLYPLDRWQLSPSTSLVSEYGPEYGMPEFYRVTGDESTGRGGSLLNTSVHYSRILRFEGVTLPYRQRTTEDGWGMSVIERLRDRLIAYDSSTQGAAQLVQKAHLRTYGVKGLREIIAGGGTAYDGLIKHLEMIREYQSNEGLTLIDAEDQMQFDSYTFSGLADIMAEFGQQLAGAADITLVRLFGQSPRGFSTGETDVRNYYDMIRAKQGTDLDDNVRRAVAVTSMSVLHKPLPETFSFEFVPLWQLTDSQKAEIANTDATRIGGLVRDGVLSRGQGLKELRDTSGSTGRYTSISDDEIDDAVNAPPRADLEELAREMPELPGNPVAAASSGPAVPSEPEEATIQEVSLNGAQLTSMIDVVSQVAQKKLPRAGGVAMLEIAFRISAEEAERIMDEAGNGFVPAEGGA